MSTALSPQGLGEISQNTHEISADELERQVYGDGERFSMQDVLYLELGSRAASALEIIPTEELDPGICDVKNASELHFAILQAKPDTKAHKQAIKAEASYFFEHEMTPEVAEHVLGRFEGRTRTTNKTNRLLTKGEEIALAKTLEMGDEAQEKLEAMEPLADPEHRAGLEATTALAKRAYDRFIKSNLGLAAKQAKGFAEATGVEFDDLMQEGYLALDHTLSKFDWRKDIKFSTYATWWINQYLPRYIAEKAKLFHIPHNKASEVRSALELEDEIGEDAGEDARRVRDLMSVDSLDAPIGDSSFSIKDTLSDPGDTADHALERLDASELYQHLRQLPEDMRYAFVRRHGLGGTPKATNDEIATELGIGRDSIRKRLKDATEVIMVSFGVLAETTKQRTARESREARLKKNLQKDPGLANALESMDETQQVAIILRRGLDGGGKRTLKEIGEKIAELRGEDRTYHLESVRWLLHRAENIVRESQGQPAARVRLKPEEKASLEKQSLSEYRDQFPSLDEAMSSLTESQRLAVTLRRGLDGEGRRSYSAIGKELARLDGLEKQPFPEQVRRLIIRAENVIREFHGKPTIQVPGPKNK